MAGVVVTYRVRVAEADANQHLVERVFEELSRTSPEGLRYATFRLLGGGDFLHVALIEDPERNPLSESAAFAAFQRDLPARCEVLPAPASAELVGSYRLF